jgi:hypothetical protein
MFDDRDVDWTDYDQLKAACKELGRPGEYMVALSRENDPFAIRDGRVQMAKWLATVWHDLRITGTVHVRRIHYVIVSHKDIAFPKGGNYENTERHWDSLRWAVRDARYLELIPGDDFEDRRNAVPIVHLVNGASSAHVGIPQRAEFNMPDLPELYFWEPKIDQRYHVEIWAEKTTQNDILEPIAQRYGINLITGAGELSYTACSRLMRRIEEIGRPTRILYISDFDPSGENMPVSVARKVEYFIRKNELDLDVQVRPIALTKEQCEEYRLPRVPLKTNNKSNIARAERWEEKHGEGATELDALEALHPGSLRQIVEAEIDRYHDHDLEAGVNEEAAGIEAEIDDTNESVQAEFEDQIEEIKAEFEDLKARVESLYLDMDTRLREEAPDLEGIDWPEPADGDDDDDPLYCSSRDYVEQIERYKLHQGKPIDGPARSGKWRKAKDDE